jgi:hypothetical protein
MDAATVALAVGMTVAEPRQRPVLHCTPASVALCDERSCWSEFRGALSYIVNLDRRVVSRCIDIQADDCELSPIATVAPDGPTSVVLSDGTTALRVSKGAEFALTSIFTFDEDGATGVEVAFGTCAPFGAREAAARRSP